LGLPLNEIRCSTGGWFL